MVTLGKKTNSAYVFFANDPIPTLPIGGAVLFIFIPKMGRNACKRLPFFRKVPPFGHLFLETGGFQESY